MKILTRGTSPACLTSPRTPFRPQETSAPRATHKNKARLLVLDRTKGSVVRLLSALRLVQRFVVENFSAYELLLVVLTFVLYWPVLSHGFTNYDDPFFVTDNPNVRNGLSFTSIKYAFCTLLGFYHPVTWLSLTLDSHLSGGRAVAFHMTNLWLHAINAVLVLRLLSRLVAPSKLAFTIALMFLVHPANVEAVAWVSERKGLLSATFFLFALLCYLRHLDQGRIGDCIWALVSFAMSLLSKPNHMVAFPILILVLPMIYHNGSLGRKDGQGYQGLRIPRSFSTSRRAIFWTFGVALVLSATAGALAVLGERNIGVLRSLADYSIADRAAICISFFGRSLRNAVVPSWATPVDLWEFPGAHLVVFEAIALASITFAAIRLRHARPWLLIGWTWFILLLLPMSGVLKHGDQLTAQRYVYLPLVGVMFCLLRPLFSVAQRFSAVRVLTVVLVSFWVAAYALESVFLMRNWSDSQALWRFSLMNTRRNWVAANNLGAEFIRQKHFAEAEACLGDAVAWRPDYEPAVFNLALTSINQGKYRRAHLLLRTAERLQPTASDVHRLLGQVSTQLNDPAAAEAWYEKAISDAPDDPGALKDLAIFLARHGSEPGKLKRALEMEDRARRLIKKRNEGQEVDAASLVRSARILARLGDTVAAKQTAESAAQVAIRFGDFTELRSAREIVSGITPKPFYFEHVNEVSDDDAQDAN